jgi:hypothetical protein
MPVLAALLFLSDAAAQASPPLPTVPSAEVAAERVRACGFDQVSVKEDDELQEEVVEVSGVSAVPESKMRCAVQVSLDTDCDVIFPEPANKAYWRLYSQMEEKSPRAAAASAWMQGNAREWLRKRGLLAKVPKYVKGKDDNLRFARRLEDVCGPKAKGMFRLVDGHVVLWPAPVGKAAADFSTVECLINAAAASGMRMGFVGNEYTGTR